MPYDYASGQSAIARKRKLAEMLQQQATSPTEIANVPGARLHPLTIALKGLTGLMSNYQGSEADKAAAEDAAAREAGVAEHMKNMPQATPGVPSMPIEQEQVGPGPAAPPPGPPPGLAAAFGASGMPDVGPRDNELKGSGSAMAAQLLGGGEAPPPLAPPPGPPPGPPLLPQKMDMAAPGMLPKLSTDAIPGKEVSPQDLLKYGMGFNKFGPDYADIGKQVTAGAVKSMLPMTPDQVAELAAKKELKYAELQQRADDARLRGDTAAAATAQREADSIRDDKRMRDIAAQNNETKKALHAALGALGGAGNTTDVGVDAKTGMPVVRGKDGRRYTMNNDTGAATPYNGEVIPQAQHEKNVTGVMSAMTEADMAEKAAKAIENPAAADAFETVKRGKMGLGMSPQQAGVSKEGQAVLAMTGRDFAEQTKKLYGASFTDSEQKRAAGFTITNKDDATSAAVKARDAARFAREMSEKYGGAAAAAAARRTVGGGAAAPAAAGSSPGWGPVTKG